MSSVNYNCTGVTVPSSRTNEITAVDIHVSRPTRSESKMEGRKKYNVNKNKVFLETDLDQEFLIENNDHNSLSIDDPVQTSSHSLDNQRLPIYDASPPPYVNSSDAESPLQVIVSAEETVSPLSTTVAPIRYIKPINVSSTIFSFVMTAAFVCILWLVVFMIFGYKGHAIAGVFIALFIIGLLINTCFLKLYFRLRVFLGLSASIAVAERQASRRRQHQLRKTKLALEKSVENPPSYSSVVEAPPTYSFLQFYRSKKSSLSVNSAASQIKSSRKKHKCPFCRREVRLFGICIACKSELQKK